MNARRTIRGRPSSRNFVDREVTPKGKPLNPVMTVHTVADRSLGSHALQAPLWPHPGANRLTAGTPTGTVTAASRPSVLTAVAHNMTPRGSVHSSRTRSWSLGFVSGICRRRASAAKLTGEPSRPGRRSACASTARTSSCSVRYRRARTASSAGFALAQGSLDVHRRGTRTCSLWTPLSPTHSSAWLARIQRALCFGPAAHSGLPADVGRPTRCSGPRSDSFAAFDSPFIRHSPPLESDARDSAPRSLAAPIRPTPGPFEAWR